MYLSPSVGLWILIAAVGLGVSLVELASALADWRWLRRAGVNGARHILATTSLLTAAIRAIEMLAALGAGLIGATLAPQPLLGLRPIVLTVLLFVIAVGICLSSFLSARARHRVLTIVDKTID